jgi:hypothetical protein
LGGTRLQSRWASFPKEFKNINRLEREILREVLFTIRPLIGVILMEHEGLANSLSLDFSLKTRRKEEIGDGTTGVRESTS